MCKILMSVILALGSSVVYAGYPLAPQTIKEIATGWGQEGIYVVTAERIQIPQLSCGASPNFIISNANPYMDKMLSMLLSAQATKSKVVFYVDGCLNASYKLEAVNIQTQ